MIDASPALLSSLPQVITAIGGLGTAAFGLLDASKSIVPWINNIGFPRIEALVASLTPLETALNAQGQAVQSGPPVNALPQKAFSIRCWPTGSMGRTSPARSPSPNPSSS